MSDLQQTLTLVFINIRFAATHYLAIPTFFQEEKSFIFLGVLV